MTETAQTTISPAGDPFVAAGRDECNLRFRGYLTITIEEDDDEIYVAVRYKHCNKGGVMAENTCYHPPTRLFAWYAYDGTLCVCCCECSEVLRGGAEEEAQ